MKAYIAGFSPDSISFRILKESVEGLGHETVSLQDFPPAADIQDLRGAASAIASSDALLVPMDRIAIWTAAFELSIAFGAHLPIYVCRTDDVPVEKSPYFSMARSLSVEFVSVAELGTAIGRNLPPEESSEEFPFSTVRPAREVDAYEAIWAEQDGRSLFTVNRLLKGRRPSGYHAQLRPDVRSLLEKRLSEGNIHTHPVIVRGTREFPSEPRCRFPLLYCRGDLAMLDLRSVCVTACGADQRQIDETVGILTDSGTTVVTGLEREGDRRILQAVLDRGGRAVAVSGRPLSYARKGLEADLARGHLIVSHVPYFQYSRQSDHANLMFAHEMNAVMAVLSRFSIILGPVFDQGHRLLAGECSYLGKTAWLCGDKEENIYFRPYSDVKIVPEPADIDFTEAAR